MVARNKSRKRQSNMGNCAPRDFRMVQAGEKVAAMGQDFVRGLATCMQDNGHRREPYWILFHAQWTEDHQKLRMIFSPRDKCPPKMLATICYLVDNVRGELKNLWTLPHDAPATVIEGAPVCEQIANDAAGMPLVQT